MATLPPELAAPLLSEASQAQSNADEQIRGERTGCVGRAAPEWVPPRWPMARCCFRRTSD